MNWREAASTILDRLLKQKAISPDICANLRRSCVGSDAKEVFAVFKEHLQPIGRGWNKVWAGNTLYGWWGGFITEEPIRLVAIEIAANEGIRSDIIDFLTSRWNNQAGSRLSSDPEKIVRDLALEVVPGKLSCAELRILQRINLDRREQVFIEKWRWSLGAGVAYLSDDGRETIRPELACSRVIEAIYDDRGVIPVEWKNRLAGLDASVQVLKVSDLSQHPQFVEAVEFWGIGRVWDGGVKFIPETISWFGKFARIS